MEVAKAKKNKTPVDFLCCCSVWVFFYSGLMLCNDKLVYCMTQTTTFP